MCCAGAQKLSAAAEDFAGDGQKGAGAAVPFGHAIEAEAGGGEGRGRQGGNLSLRFEWVGGEGGAEGFDAGFGRFEAGNNAFFEKPGNEQLHLQLGRVESLAGSVVALFDDGAERFQLPQPLADRALANVETPGDFFHAQRILTGEKETVDLTVRLWIAEQLGEVGENIDKARFVVGGECGAWSRGRVFEGGGHGGDRMAMVFAVKW